MAKVTEKIVTGQTEIAANLEQLRYLVIRGIDGKSAYDVAVSLGFEGTEQEWLDSLVGPKGPEGKNYGFQIDTDTELDGIIIKDPEMTVVKTVNGQSGDVEITADTIGAAKAASYAGANHPPMDDLTANELLDCVYSYIDNADKLFYSGMNAQYIADCTDLEKVRSRVISANVGDAELHTAVEIAESIGDIKDAIDAYADRISAAAGSEDGETPDEDDDSETESTDPIYTLREKLKIAGNWAKKNSLAAIDYLLSGRKPIHCAWFAYLISSGIRYETSLYAGNAEEKRFYDWGFDWADYEPNGYPLANLEAKYCVEQGYGFTPDSADFHELRTGDILFFANGSDASFGNIGHVGVFLYHNADGQKCTVVDVSSEAPDGTNTTYPIQVKTYGYDSAVMQKCTIAARLPYAGSGRVGQMKNLFVNEAACRNDERTLTAESPVFARGSFCEQLKLNRFYTFDICMEKSSGVGDLIRLQGIDSGNTGVIGTTIDAATGDRADGVYSITLFHGRYRSPSYAMYSRLNGSGIRFRSFDPSSSDAGIGIAQEVTVKWIACYEGIHHVGRDGFVPYDRVPELVAALATLPAPAVTEQPQDATIDASESAVFTVSAAGYGLRYLWQYRLNASGNWVNCSSATQGYNTDTLTVQGAKDTGTRNGYQYRCGIVDANGKTTFSEAATLTVEVS